MSTIKLLHRWNILHHLPMLPRDVRRKRHHDDVQQLGHSAVTPEQLHFVPRRKVWRFDQQNDRIGGVPVELPHGKVRCFRQNHGRRGLHKLRIWAVRYHVWVGLLLDVQHPFRRERYGDGRLRATNGDRVDGQAKRYWNTGCERDPPENRWRQGEPLLQSGERRGALCHVIELDRGKNGRNVMQHAIQ